MTLSWRFRARVARLIQRNGLDHDQQARLARTLGVSATTISRDITALLALVAPCPYYGSYPLPPQPPAGFRSGGPLRRGQPGLAAVRGSQTYPLTLEFRKHPVGILLDTVRSILFAGIAAHRYRYVALSG